jgi:preprotein translocase subunit SecG
MWSTAFTILHILACIFLVVVVLLQTGKGTDVNAVFGGSSQTIFGSSGAGNFLTKLTTATAAIFMATSLFLTYGISRQTTKSVFDNSPPTAVTTPTTPEQAPATPESTSGATGDKPAEAPAASQTTPAPSASASPTPPPTTTPTEAAKTPTTETKPAENTAKTPAPSQTVPSAPK